MAWIMEFSFMIRSFDKLCFESLPCARPCLGSGSPEVATAHFTSWESTV